MVMTGEEDLRTPMAQSEEYYRALKVLRKADTLLVRQGDGVRVDGLNERPILTPANSAMRLVDSVVAPPARCTSCDAASRIASTVFTASPPLRRPHPSTSA